MARNREGDVLTERQSDEESLRQCLHLVKSLQDAMEAVLRAECAERFKYMGFRQFARKYNQLLDLVMSKGALPPVIDRFNIEDMPTPSGSVVSYQKPTFESVHMNLLLLRGFLESATGVSDDEFLELREFLASRLRSAVFRKPDHESQIQDTIEALLVGRGMQKGQDYDREVGRVKVATKESVPDFIIPKLSLAMEIKLVKRADRAKTIVDEINADIASYSKRYRSLLFVVYDLGHIRNVAEFRFGFETNPDTHVVVVKH